MSIEGDISKVVDSCSIQYSNMAVGTRVYKLLNRIVYTNDEIIVILKSTKDVSVDSFSICPATTTTGSQIIKKDFSLTANKEKYIRFKLNISDALYLSLRLYTILDDTDYIDCKLVCLNSVNRDNKELTLQYNTDLQSKAKRELHTSYQRSTSSYTSIIPDASFKVIGANLLISVKTNIDTKVVLHTSTSSGGSSIVEFIGKLITKANEYSYIRFKPTQSFERILIEPDLDGGTVEFNLYNIDSVIDSPDIWNDNIWHNGYIMHGYLYTADTGNYQYSEPIAVKRGDVIVGTCIKVTGGERNYVWKTDENASYYTAICHFYYGNTVFYLAEDDGYIALNRRSDGQLKLQMHRRSAYAELIEAAKYQEIRYSKAKVEPIIRNLTANIPHGSGELEKPLCLLHFSDVHGSMANVLSIKNFFAGFGVSDVICTGDMVAGKFTDWNANLWNTEGVDKFLLTIGNHDVYDVNNLQPGLWSGYDAIEYRCTPLQAYNQYFKDNISKWGVTQPADASTEGKNYYYKDYDCTSGADSYLISKIRLIVIDCMDGGYVGQDGSSATTSQAQKDWLAATLEDARTNGYPILIANHFPPNCNNITGFDTPFHSFETGMDHSYHIINWAVDAVDTFINNGGEFVCWLTGHLHYDHVGILNAHPNQIFIAVPSANSGAVWLDTIRGCYEDNFDMFNMVSIDPRYKRITVYRFGAKWDKWMRHREAMCIDYANRRLLSTY